MSEDWSDHLLGDIAEVIGGGTPSTSQHSYWGGSIPWITPGEVTRNEGMIVTETLRTITSEGLAASSATLLPEHAVLMTSRATVGAVALAGRPMATNQGFAALVARKDVLPHFLMYWVQANRAEFEGRASGSTFPEINRSKVKAVPVRLPGLSEQLRIVDLIGTLDTLLRSSENALERVRESRSALEQQICRELSLLDAVQLGDIADVVGGVTKDKKKQDVPGNVEVPYLRVANVQRGYLVLDEITTIKVPTSTADRLLLRGGDLLLNEGGDRDKLGRGWVWEEQVPNCIHQNHVFRARIHDPQAFNPRFLSMWANTFGPDWFWANGGQTTGIASISMSRIKQFPVPLVDPENQLAAVEVIDALRDCQQAMDREIRSLQHLRATLLTSLLSGAFQIPDSYDSLHVAL